MPFKTPSETLPRGVQRVVKRRADGAEAEYFYHRATKTRLPHPDDKNFAAALHAARMKGSIEPGTVGALLEEYKRTPEWRVFSPETKRIKLRAFDFLQGMARVPVAAVRRRDVLAIRDALADTPGIANQFAASVSALLAFAVDREYRDSNPAARIKKIRGGEWAAWPDSTVTIALGALPERFRRALLLALYTGQREGDVVAMTWARYDGAGIEVRQEKTDEPLWIPCHPALRAELDAWKAEAQSTHMLTDSDGKPWTSKTFRVAFSRIINGRKNKLRGKTTIIPPAHPALVGLTFHGLRKSAASRLAEAGCTTQEIMAITGHRTLAMVEKYTRAAEQKRRAVAAVEKLSDWR